MSQPESLVGERERAFMAGMACATPPGPFIEVGVYKGGSAWNLAQVAEMQGRQIYLFDTFNGIPCRRPDVDHHAIGDFADTSAQAVKDAIPYARVIPGVFPPKHEEVFLLKGIAFAHIDVDQYQSVKDCITFLGVRMRHGGIMLFDDYNLLQGATMAVDEMLAEQYQIYRTPHGKAFVRF